MSDDVKQDLERDKRSRPVTGGQSEQEGVEHAREAQDVTPAADQPVKPGWDRDPK